MPDFWSFPTVSMGLGPINAIYQARFMRYLENRGMHSGNAAQGLGLPGRRRNGRARIDGLAHAGLARKARQPDLRDQLQSAAAGRSGARQRQGDSGTGSGLPRRRLERDQGDLGRGLGRAAGARHHRPAATAHGRSGGRRIPDLRDQGRRVHPPAFLRQVSGTAGPGGAPERRRTFQAAARRPRSARKSTTPTSRRWTPRGSRR